jgi:hypothetical protein
VGAWVHRHGLDIAPRPGKASGIYGIELGL